MEGENYQEVCLELTKKQIEELIKNLEGIKYGDSDEQIDDHFHMRLEEDLGLTISIK